MRTRSRLGRWMLLVIGAGLLGSIPAAWGRGRDTHAGRPVVVVVKYGESLWTIAEAHRDPAMDVRDVVSLIAADNNVDPGALRPGSTLILPASCLPEDDSPR